jgi:D-aminopeptidase
MRAVSSNEAAVDINEGRIDAIFAELDQNRLPGAAVGIAIGGKPVYRKGFGLASMELPVVLGPSTRMRIQSTSKHFTCLLFMLLCEEGEARLDDPIGRYIPELHPVAQPITAYQLMTHTSGLFDVHDIRYGLCGTVCEVPTHELISLYRGIDEVNFKPGTGWSYCNGGYGLLSVAIERITDQPLEDAMGERVFKQVGMRDSLLRRFDDGFVSNCATNHMATSDGYKRVPPIGALAGNGGIVSTIDDMLRWLAHMDQPVIGSDATWAALQTPAALTNGVSTGYGLGLITEQYRGVEILHHAGGTLGSNSQMLKVPAAGLDIEVMLNRDDVSAVSLVNQILDACLPGLESAGDSSTSSASGVFWSPTSGRVIELVATEDQQIARIDGGDLPVVPDSDGVLRPAPGLTFLKQALILVGDPAKPASIRYSDFGNSDELMAVHIDEDPDLTPIVGSYRSDATGTDATIWVADGDARLRTIGPFGRVEYSLVCLAPGIWRVKAGARLSTGGVLSFDQQSAVFRYASSRTRGLTFRRCI